MERTGHINAAQFECGLTELCLDSGLLFQFAHATQLLCHTGSSETCRQRDMVCSSEEMSGTIDTASDRPVYGLMVNAEHKSDDGEGVEVGEMCEVLCNRFDTEGNGQLMFEDMVSMMDWLGIADRKFLDEIWRHMDGNNIGSVSYEKFKSVLVGLAIMQRTAAAAVADFEISSESSESDEGSIDCFDEGFEDTLHGAVHPHSLTRQRSATHDQEYGEASSSSSAEMQDRETSKMENQNVVQR